MSLISGKSRVRYLRTLVLQVCGPVVSVEGSRRDLQQLVQNDVLDGIVALSRDFVTPELITPQLTAFCNHLYTLQDIYDVTPAERIGRALEQAFGGQTHALQHTTIVLISRGAHGVETTAFAHGPPNSRPWGIPVPACGKCGGNARIRVDSHDKKFYFDEEVRIESEKQGADKVAVVMTKRARYICDACDATAKVLRPKVVKVWRSPCLRHFYQYPYPTSIVAEWAPAGESSDTDPTDAEKPNAKKAAPKKSAPKKSAPKTPATQAPTAKEPAAKKAKYD
ncbi:hypothetical protein BD410DRAFT_847209 [Rickenella mellea]|uniref:Uncharacterized protein n=1 Tax=Rickenella mellea TaxID=50990 RepID=A0A4Y7PDT2_9AGAM|nr:hypothetical protein BD410DRAFT_847209 [Rickenella mellea]